MEKGTKKTVKDKRRKSNTMRWFNAQSVTVRAAIIGGIITGGLGLVGAIITGSFSIIEAKIISSNEDKAKETEVSISEGHPTTEEDNPDSNIIENVIYLNDSAYYLPFGIVASLDHPIDYISEYDYVSLVPTNCFVLAKEGETLYGDCDENCNDFSSDTNSIETAIYLNVFTADTPILVHSVDLILEGYYPITEKDIEEIFELSGFGGGELLENFEGDGGNVRPNKIKVDLWGGASPVQIYSNSGVRLVLPIRFQEQGVYTYHIEVTAQELLGDWVKFISQSDSYGWLSAHVDPQSIELVGTFSSEAGYYYKPCDN